jgi:ribonuclease HI
MSKFTMQSWRPFDELFVLQLTALSNPMARPVRHRSFTDAQAAIKRIVSLDPGPGQAEAGRIVQELERLHRRLPDATVELRWCPGHGNDPNNEKADKWAKYAAASPDSPDVEWATSLSHIKKRRHRA